MLLFVTVLHVFLSLFLITVILLQPGKGGDVGAAFGGGGMGGGAMFGPRGPASLLSQATTVVAVLFMVTSISLSYYSSRKIQKNINIEDELQRLQSAEQIAAPIPEIKPEDNVDEEAVSE